MLSNLKQHAFAQHARRGLSFLVVALIIAGCEWRQNMYDNGRVKPYEETPMFQDKQSNRPLVEGTVSRGNLKEDAHFYEGKVGGKLAQTLPMKATKELLLRGKERFNIYCSVCHGYAGRGNGMAVQRGYRPQPASFHSDRLKAMPVGYYFQVITQGFAKMPSYKTQIAEKDRWAIASYIQTLQWAGAVDMDKVPLEGQQLIFKGIQDQSAQDAAAESQPGHHLDNPDSHTDQEEHR